MFPDVLLYVIEPSLIASPPLVKVTVGVEIVSLAVSVSVITSLTLAKVLVLLFDAIATLERVGIVSSNVTLVPFVTAVTAVPALPTESLKATLNVTKPFVSSASAV